MANRDLKVFKLKNKNYKVLNFYKNFKGSDGTAKMAGPSKNNVPYRCMGYLTYLRSSLSWGLENDKKEITAISLLFERLGKDSYF